MAIDLRPPARADLGWPLPAGAALHARRRTGVETKREPRYWFVDPVPPFSIVIGQSAETVLCTVGLVGFGQHKKKMEIRMRILIAALVVMITCPVLADEADDARRLAVSGRDAYWNCLAREYPRESNRNMPEQEFGALIAAACASERQNFRVALVGYLGIQFPDKDADANLTTANNAIAFAQKDIVTAFARRKAASK
jgi:hypothetical protein